MVSSDFLHTQLSFCVFCCAQLSGNFLQIFVSSKKWCDKKMFILFFSLIFEKNVFDKPLLELKVSTIVCFLLFKDKGKRLKITGISGFVFSCPQMAVGPSCQKKGFFGPTKIKQKCD